MLFSNHRHVGPGCGWSGSQVLDLGPITLGPAGLVGRDTEPGTFYGSGPHSSRDPVEGTEPLPMPESNAAAG